MAMTMSGVSLALFASFLAMSAIGIGPSMYFLSGKNSISTALGISPATGFVVSSLIGTYLTLLNCPIERSSPLILTVGMTISLALVLAARISARDRWFDWKRILQVLGPFILLWVLAMAPQVVGGLRYSILRGNGSDSFNYITVAGYLDHEPYSLAAHADVTSLVERHPSYERARQLLNARWATSMMLAFTSRIGGTAPYKFEYFFSVLCFLMAFGPVYLYCRHLSDLWPLVSALTAVAVCGGFWAQLILDMRADSQLTSIPVLLLLAFLIARMEMDGSGLWRREVVLVAASGASLLVLYPEIAPLTVLGIGLFAGIRWWQREAAPGAAARLVVAACLALVAVAPTWNLLLAFGTRQLGVATNARNNWDVAYFPWLYSSPLTGAWGFGPLVAWGGWLRAPFVVFGAVLTVLLLAALVRALYRGNGARPGGLLAATLTTAALCQWAYLCTEGQRWAAAKGLSFGYPFLMMSVAIYAFRTDAAGTGGWRVSWGRLAKASVCGMLLIQCGLAFCRPVLAWRGWEYPNYINGHGEYKRHDWNMAPFAAVLESHNGAVVWSDLSNAWLADYVGFVFGWDVRVANIGTSRDIVDFKIPQPRPTTGPEYVFVERAGGVNHGAALAAQNTELSLLKTDPISLPILSLQNPNGLEGGDATPFFWLGTKAATLTLLSPTSASVMSGQFGIGPSNPPNLGAVDLTLTSGVGRPQHFRVAAGRQEFAVLTNPGLDHITLQVENPAVRFLPSDARPLLLRVDNLRFQRGR
jgi:hypothetical protein